MKKTTGILLNLFVCLLVTSVRGQSVPVVNVNPATDCPGQICFDEPHSNGTWGWTFYVNAPITITDIGWFDQNGDGLSHSHAVGLWKDLSGSSSWPYISGTGQQLFGANGILIPAGSGAQLNGAWRTVPIPSGSMTLQPGGYALGGVDNTNSTDGIRYMLDRPPGLPHDPRITVGAPGYSNGSGLQRPTEFFLVNGVEFGPTLFVIPVPEPATISLLGFALAAHCNCNRRRRLIVAPQHNGIHGRGH